MNKKVLGLIAAGVMALVGTVVLVMWARGAEDRASSDGDVVPALVAIGSIPAGTSSADLASQVEVREVPAALVPEGVVTSLEEVADLVTAVEILPGEPLVAARFLAPGERPRRTGPVEVPEGMLEVTIAMSQEQFVGGVPVPGDRVAVIANGRRADFIPFLTDPLQSGQVVTAEGGSAADITVTKIIIQQALVTNVQGNPLPAAPAASATDRVAPAEGSLLVSLALDGTDTERLLYVRDGQTLNANIHMALHTSEGEVPSSGVSVENVVDGETVIG